MAAEMGFPSWPIIFGHNDFNNYKALVFEIKLFAARSSILIDRPIDANLKGFSIDNFAPE